MPLHFELGRRFFILTLFGYSLAVASAVLAVHFTSQPILKKMQREALIDHAASNAQNVEIRLARITQALTVVARSPEVINYAIGDFSSSERVKDFLSSIDVEDGLRRATVLDFLGTPLTTYEFEADAPTTFLPVELSVAAVSVVKENAEKATYVYRPSETPGHANFLITVPIRWRGMAEGALVFERSIDLSQIVDIKTTIGTQKLATRFQAQMSKVWGDEKNPTLMTPIPQTSFFLVLEPDQEAVRAIGNEIVSTVMISVGLILIIPFGLMCGAGYHSLVAPHKALQDSREQLRRKQVELRELAEISQRSNDAITVTDIEGKVIWGNPAFSEVTGYEIHEVIGKRPGDVLQGTGTDPEERDRISAAIRERRPVRSEILNYTREGRPYWIALSIAPLLDDHGEAYRFVAISSDITAQRAQKEAMLRAKREIEYQALHDPLTGLPNRRSLDVELEAICAAGSETRTLIRIDLDHFKYVNDTLGHAAGDFVLIEVSKILTKLAGNDDLAARVGGDEFVILLGADKQAEDARRLAEECLVAIRKEMEFEGRPCRVGASFGIASANNEIVSNSTLLLAADAALYLAKDRGRNTVATYSQKMHADVIEKRVLAAEIEQAIVEESFEPFFQPQIDAKTGGLAGLEALVRWRHPTRGVLTPDVFLPVAYQLSVVDAIDKIVLTKGLKTIEKLNRAGHQLPKISFNVVAKQLEDPALSDMTLSYNLAPTIIAFEVLESVLIEEQSTEFKFQIDRLKEQGFHIEVDDFGSGHASIIGLMHLSPNAMKIDQRLIFPLTELGSARQMVRAIIEIGKALGIQVTAEGVESEEHARILAAMGCDTLQGFHYAKPMDAQDLDAFLKRQGVPQRTANAI
ncbi:MAG: EAL domain-containing protein [Pseudomonadota bacterium]